MPGERTVRLMQNEADGGAASKFLLGIVLLLPLGLSGCLHKNPQMVTLPINSAPLELASVPEPEDPPMIEVPPAEELQEKDLPSDPKVSFCLKLLTS